jgi:hypothetical protein
MSKAKMLGVFVLVSLPSLFLLLLTADAPLSAGADAFVVSLVQVLFIGAFMWIDAR